MAADGAPNVMLDERHVLGKPWITPDSRVAAISYMVY